MINTTDSMTLESDSRLSMQPKPSTLKSQQGSDMITYQNLKNKSLLEYKTMDNRAFKKNKKKISENKIVTKKMKILAKRVSRNSNAKNYGLKQTFSGGDSEIRHIHQKTHFL